jgi:SAM-dependent methyltransferase
MSPYKTAARQAQDLRAELYEWECRHVLGRSDQDVPFWLEMTRAARGPVLELACGTGRVTLPLATAGVEMVGLDIDPAMLKFARRAPFPRALFIAADMRRFALARKFAAIIVPYNSFQLLTEPTDAALCLRLVAAHLARGGVLGLEVTDFQAGAVVAGAGHEVISTGSIDGVRLTLSGSLFHDFDSRTTAYHRRFSAPEWQIEDIVTIRSYGQEELGALLAGAGFTTDRWWQAGRCLKHHQLSQAPLTRLLRPGGSLVGAFACLCRLPGEAGSYVRLHASPGRQLHPGRPMAVTIGRG